MSPLASLRPCSGRVGCSARVSSGKCKACAGESDRRRGTAAERGYDKHWRPVRDAHLAEFPLCGGKRADAYHSTMSECARLGFVTAATVVHHIQAHKRDRALLLDPRNLESACKRCHDRMVDEGDFGR